MSAHRGANHKKFRSGGKIGPGPPIESTAAEDATCSCAGWDAVEQLIARLARTRAVFPSAGAHSNWVSAYEPGRRFLVDSDGRSNWIQVEHVRACWETFERTGRVRRSDVVEPGRSSAFMMALFEHLPGVRRQSGDAGYLVLEPPRDRVA